MKYYGIETKGYFKLEILSSLPEFTIEDEGRLIYLSTNKLIYVNNGIEYITILTPESVKNVIDLPEFSDSNEGELYYNSITNKLYYNNGSTYISLDNLEWPYGTTGVISFDGDNTTEVYTNNEVEIGRVESVKTTPEEDVTVITQSKTKNGIDSVEVYTFNADGTISISYDLI